MRGNSIVWLAALAAVTLGCSRSHYRLRADADAYSAIEEKSACLPWMPPTNFSIHPSPASRLHFHSPLDDPALPLPAPQLYAYDLPGLPERDPNRFYRPETAGMFGPSESGVVSIRGQRVPTKRLPRVPIEWSDRSISGHPPGPVLAANFHQPVSAEPPLSVLDAPPVSPEQEGVTNEIRISPIPVEAWEVIPAQCRRRMFDFESLLREADLTRTTFSRDVVLPPDGEASRLALEDIVDLGLLNSREYQAQKEALYLVALRLSLERFDYQLKFSPTGHRTGVDFTHDRVGGITVNGLSTPTTFSAEKMLLTGGDLLARFANDVVLTFNGPQGFAANVGSDLLLDLSQPILQRDIGFEPLTQAERNVLYEARDFARFRKQFFADLAQQYYTLIRTFRQVEIDSQNYFSLVRAFNQREAEYQAGIVPRVQVDQVEQQMLSGRGRLISTCNSIEQSLDNLKIELGLPTELPLNIDLIELEQLTKRDQLAVTGDLVDRVRRRLLKERQNSTTDQGPDRVVLLSTASVLIDRIFDANKLRVELDLAPFDVEELRLLRSRMQVELARLTAAEISVDLIEEIGSESPSAPVIFQRTLALNDGLLGVVARQIELAELRGEPAEQIEEYRRQQELLRRESLALRDRLQRMIESEQLLLLPPLVMEAGVLRAEAESFVANLDRLLGETSGDVYSSADLEEILTFVDQLLADSAQVLAAIGGGLIPVEIETNDAMLTALVLRFELMNERESLADDWRQIKLAGDDLRSVFNLNASQRISTRTDVNRAFDFTWDESSTAVQLTFDAPLNRRAQRNSYRAALIDYQSGLRSLTQLEDNIKRAVRSDLRSLSLRREQYRIDVASAALAFERVVSTQLEISLGLGEVTARDFLEAQSAYATALSSVANGHIGYIVDRTQLFLDLELLTVGDDGFWAELYDEEFQPEPYYQLPPWAAPFYGDLPPVWYSKQMHRMLHVPPGNAMIHQDATAMENGAGEGGDQMLESIAPPAPLPPVVDY